MLRVSKAQSLYIYTYMQSQLRRKGSSGSVSRGNTPNSRYIQAEPTINLVPRRRVGAEVRAKSYEGRAREVEGRVERERRGFNQDQKAFGATDYCLWPMPFIPLLAILAPSSSLFTPLILFYIYTHLLVDRGWPMKLIIIKSHSVCRGRPPFVRPRVLLTLIRLHPGFITSYQSYYIGDGFSRVTRPTHLYAPIVLPLHLIRFLVAFFSPFIEEENFFSFIAHFHRDFISLLHALLHEGKSALHTMDARVLEHIEIFSFLLFYTT